MHLVRGYSYSNKFCLADNIPLPPPHRTTLLCEPAFFKSLVVQASMANHLFPFEAFIRKIRSRKISPIPYCNGYADGLAYSLDVGDAYNLLKRIPWNGRIRIITKDYNMKWYPVFINGYRTELAIYLRASP